MKKNSGFILLLLVLPMLWGSSSVGSPHVFTSSEVTSPSLPLLTPPPKFSTSNEFDTVDTFDVHPDSGRWDIIDSTNLDSHTVENSIYNVTETGDGTSDYIVMKRDLRDLSGTIEYRFKLESNGSTHEYGNRAEFYLISGDEQARFRFYVTYIKNTTTTARIDFDDVDGNSYTEYLNYQVYAGYWYKMRLDYDISLSQLRYRLYHDNDSKLSDTTWQDCSTAAFPEIFGATSLKLYYVLGGYSVNQTTSILLDYVKAPFKEREWEQTEAPSDSDWLQDNFGFHQVQDNIDDNSEWDLVVPYLDAVQGVMTTEVNTPANFAVGEGARFSFYVFAVDGDDGDLHEAVEVNLYRSNLAGTYYSELIIDFDASSEVYRKTLTATTDPRVSFTIGLEADRSRITVKTRLWEDRLDTSDGSHYDFAGSYPISSIATDPSQEFVLRTEGLCSFDGDLEWTAMIESLEIIERDVFHDFGGLLGPPPTDDGGSSGVTGLGFFQGIFDAIAAFLSWVLSPISDFIQDIISGLVDLASDVWNGIESTLSFITSAINGLWTLFIGVIDDIIAELLLLAEDFADFVFSALEFLIDLLLTIASELWSVLETVIFFVWDALNLPNLIDVFNSIISTVIDVIGAIPSLITDIMSWVVLFGSFGLLIWWVWAFFLSFAEAKFNPFEGMGNFIEKCFFDLLPFSFLGIEIYVPMGLFFLPLTFFMLLTESAFFIW